MTEKRTWVGPSAPERLNILRNTRTIAIVGMSDKISRASNFVATYLLSSSPYTVYFVNPILAAKGKTVLGQPVYASLQDLPEVPDLVEIFRRNEDLPGVVQEAVDLGAKTVWMQLGSWNEEAAAIGEAAGLNVVMDRCVKIEHARFHGGLHLAGFADYGADDLGGEREGSVDASVRRQATFRAQDGVRVLAKADILPLTPCYNSTGKELTELTGIGHVDP